ncbi:MAG: hypothetical protein AAF614_30485 [Chloroflexota bacterium]
MYRYDFPHAIEELTQTVTDKAGVLDQDIRQAIVKKTAVGESLKGGENNPVPTNLQSYLEKVAHYSYKVTDQDINRLKYAGYTEDDIFEATVSVALGAALERMNQGYALFAD